MKENSYQNLISIINLFRNRPSYLAKFLMDNRYLSDDFLFKLDSDILDMDKIGNGHVPYFNSIEEMNRHYRSIIDQLSDFKSAEEMSIITNQRLKKAIEDENYEEAALIRDYMLVNKIQKIKKI